MNPGPEKKIVLRRERVEAVRDALERLEKAGTARDVAACLRDLEQAVWWLRRSVNRALLPWGRED